MPRGTVYCSHSQVDDYQKRQQIPGRDARERESQGYCAFSCFLFITVIVIATAAAAVFLVASLEMCFVQRVMDV